MHEVVGVVDPRNPGGTHRLQQFGALRIVAGPHPEQDLPTQSLQRRGGEDPLRGTPLACVEVDPGVLERRGDRGRNVPVGDEPERGPGGPDRIDHRLVPGTVQHDHNEFPEALSKGLGSQLEDLSEGEVESDRRDDSIAHGASDDGTEGEFLDVKARDIDHAALPPVGNQHRGHDGNGVRHPFGDVAGPVDGIQSDVEPRIAITPTPKLVTHEDPWSVVLDPLPDDDLAADLDQVEHPVDRVAGGGVGRLLVTASHPLHGVQRGVLGGANELELNHPLGVLAVAHSSCGKKSIRSMPG